MLIENFEVFHLFSRSIDLLLDLLHSSNVILWLIYNRQQVYQRFNGITSHWNCNTLCGTCPVLIPRTDLATSQCLSYHLSLPTLPYNWISLCALFPLLQINNSAPLGNLKLFVILAALPSPHYSQLTGQLKCAWLDLNISVHQRTRAIDTDQ